MGIHKQFFHDLQDLNTTTSLFDLTKQGKYKYYSYRNQNIFKPSIINNYSKLQSKDFKKIKLDDNISFNVCEPHLIDIFCFQNNSKYSKEEGTDILQNNIRVINNEEIFYLKQLFSKGYENGLLKWQQEYKSNSSQFSINENVQRLISLIDFCRKPYFEGFAIPNCIIGLGFIQAVLLKATLEFENLEPFTKKEMQKKGSLESKINNINKTENNLINSNSTNNNVSVSTEINNSNVTNNTTQPYNQNFITKLEPSISIKEEINTKNINQNTSDLNAQKNKIKKGNYRLTKIILLKNLIKFSAKIEGGIDLFKNENKKAIIEFSKQANCTEKYLRSQRQKFRTVEDLYNQSPKQLQIYTDIIDSEILESKEFENNPKMKAEAARISGKLKNRLKKY